MPKLTLKVTDRHDVFGSGIDRRVATFMAAEERARQMAARAATTATRANFRYRREFAPPRAGRSSTGGHMKQHLEWTSRNGLVEFDMAEADRRVPHWIIQEIGTGQKATMRKAGQANPEGRPKKGAAYVRTVKSQKGRRISGGLVFASGGRYSPTGSARDEQLHLASKVTGVPHFSGGKQAPGIRISKEIEGQHFVRTGGREGFSEYRESVLGAARQAFRKSNRS